jgi:hypothetical protein
MTKLTLGVVMALTVLTGEARASFMDRNGLYKACTSNSYSNRIYASAISKGRQTTWSGCALIEMKNNVFQRMWFFNRLRTS